ncbi:MAG: response regulator [Bacteroidales bacterium]|nr:response regulator [Bacteroidales bacterium]
MDSSGKNTFRWVYAFEYLLLHSLLLTFFLSFISNNLFSQVKNTSSYFMPFRYITIDEGLTTNLIYEICQDKQGYIWICTPDGVNKYNGLEVKQYRSKNDKTSCLVPNKINTIFTDSQGDIWVGTDLGLCIYNEAADNFNSVTYFSERVKEFGVLDIKEDSKQNLWLATTNGLFSLNLITSEIQYFTKNNKQLPNNIVSKLWIDRQDNVWFTCYDMTLCKLNVNEMGFSYYPVPVKFDKTNIDNRIDQIYEDKFGFIWVGTHNHGVLYFDKEKNNFYVKEIDPVNAYSKRVRTFFESPDSILYIGTRAGLYLYNKVDDTFEYIASSEHTNATLNNNSIFSSYIDPQGGIWLGTVYGGVNYANIYAKRFITHSFRKDDDRFINNSNVFAFEEDHFGNIYIATENGLNILDKNTSRYRYLTHSEKGNSIAYNDLKSLSFDKLGNLWIATNNGGLDYYNSKTGLFKNYKHNPNDSTSLPSNKVYHVFVDSRNTLWVITSINWDDLPSKLSMLKEGNTRFTNFSFDVKNGICETHDGKILIGGVQGFWEYSLNNKAFRFIRNDSLIGYVNVIIEDQQGKYWIGSDKGLSYYNTWNQTFRNICETEKQTFLNVFGIVESGDNLWVSTNSGLFELEKNKTLKGETVSCTEFDKDDGLQSRQFNYNAYFKSKDGELYFGGINGYNEFYPKKIKDNMYAPKVLLSGLYIGNKEIHPGDKYIGKEIFTDPLYTINTLTIYPNIKSFTIKFDILHYADPIQNTYKYRLLGANDEWVICEGNNNQITFTGLSAGDYVLEIIGINPDGMEANQPTQLRIEVLPPFWKTLGFKIALFLTGLLLIAIYYRVRLRVLKNQKKILEDTVSKRTAELKAYTVELKNQKDEILTQSEEIRQQNEEIITQREEIEKYNIEVEKQYRWASLLNEFAEKISSSLNINTVGDLIHDYVSSILDTAIFGLGLYDESTKHLIFETFIDNGIKMKGFSIKTDENKNCEAYCFNNQRSLLLNDFGTEYKQYAEEITLRTSDMPKSAIFLPLSISHKRIGILVIQSYNYDAYPVKSLPSLQSMTSFIAITLDNAKAYEMVKKKNKELEDHKDHLAQIISDRTADLEKALHKAEESDRLKSSFLTNMSHEIRTPLNAIIGFIDLLSHKKLNEEQQNKYYQIVKTNGYALLNIINDIIEFSQIESEQIEFFNTEIQLLPILQGIYNHYVKETGYKKNSKAIIQLILNVEKLPENATLVSDPIRVKQIFSNLLTNAIKFTPKGTVEFGVKEFTKENDIIFYVKDTGIGIHKKDQDIIFDRFVKIENDTDKVFRGTGLGLTITKYLVEHMGGKIWMQSKPNAGSEFFFSLPLAKSDTTFKKLYQPGSQKSQETFNWKDKTILIAEDEESNYYLLASIFMETKAKLLWAKNGLEAVELYKANKKKINVIIMDVKMPKMNGVQAMRAIKKINMEIPVIAHTAYALANEEHTLRQELFDDYIGKPIVSEDLLILVAQYI